jgi:hypothetical protein
MDQSIMLSLNADGERALLVPLRPGENQIPSLATRGIVSEETTLADVHPDGTKQRFLRLRCTDPELLTHFGVLCDEVSSRVAQAPDEWVVRVVTDALRAWRQLVGQPKRLLSEAELVGLWGELHVLRLLGDARDCSAACWQGPLGGVHDLAFATHAIEVKSTLSLSSHVVGISSLEQLEAPPGGKLFLALCRVRRAATGESVRDLYGVVLELMAMMEEDEARLEAAGISMERLSSYDEERFTTGAVELYEVRDGFPRIVPGSFPSGTIPAGTRNLSYEVDLGHGTAFRLVPDQEQQLLSGELWV